MHELSLAMGIVKTVMNSTEGRRVERVMEIEVELGELTFVTPEQLRLAFEMASQDTIAQGAKLKIKVKQGKVRCLECGYEGKVSFRGHGEIDHRHDLPVYCPKCSGISMQILKGEGTEIKSIRVEVTGDE
jgi:hydrogenase nickel incorporation protein HypA/HybF